MSAIGFGPAIAPGRAAMPVVPCFSFDGALPPGATLTRASVATCYDAAGALSTVPADTPRFDHDPVTRTPRGLLVEGAATNLLTWSDGAIGQQSTVKQVVDAAGTLSGFANAIRFATAGMQGYVLKAYPTSAGKTYAFSAFVRCDDGQPPLPGTSNGAGCDFEVDFDGDVNLPQFLPSMPAGDGMWRFACRASVSTPSNGLFGPVRQAGNSGRLFVVSGFQLELGAVPSSYIPTAGVAAARAADVLTLDWGRRGVADGPLVVRYMFDDGSMQEAAATVVGGEASVPTTLARPWLRSATRA